MSKRWQTNSNKHKCPHVLWRIISQSVSKLGIWVTTNKGYTHFLQITHSRMQFYIYLNVLTFSVSDRRKNKQLISLKVSGFHINPKMRTTSREYMKFHFGSSLFIHPIIKGPDKLSHDTVLVTYSLKTWRESHYILKLKRQKFCKFLHSITFHTFLYISSNCIYVTAIDTSYFVTFTYKTYKKLRKYDEIIHIHVFISNLVFWKQ